MYLWADDVCCFFHNEVILPYQKKMMITIGTGISYGFLMLLRGEPMICLGSLGFLEKFPVFFNHGPNLRVLEP